LSEGWPIDMVSASHADRTPEAGQVRCE